MAIDVTIDRNKYIGGSDLPTILGWNKRYGKSILQFAKEKLGLEPSTNKPNQFTRYGQLMEPKVRDYINMEYDFSFKEDTCCDEVRKYRGNCDGLDKRKRVLFECKTFSGKLKVDYYTPQCQMYMNLFDIEECWLVGYERPEDFYTGIDYELENDDMFFNTDFDKDRLVIHIIKRDDDYFKGIETEIEKFKYLLECLKEDAILNKEY